MQLYVDSEQTATAFTFFTPLCIYTRRRGCAFLLTFANFREALFVSFLVSLPLTDYN